MKIATLTLSAISLASLIYAAPTPIEVPEDGKFVVKDVIIPEEAIVSTQVIGADQYPYVVELNGQKVVMLVNTTAAEEIVGSNFDMDSLRADLANSTEVEKRDAEADASPDAKVRWHWIKYRIGQPIAKREADAEAAPDAKVRWHWIKYRIGQPIAKREAEAEAAPDAKVRWHWIKYRIGQPIAKREAEADASPDAKVGWHWIKYRIGQPIAKRDAVADTVKFFQPIAKREDTEEETSTPGFYWITQNIEI